MSDVWDIGVARVDSFGNLYLNGGVSYQSDSVINVPTSATDTGRYENLLETYNTAKAMTPNGSPLSSENRVLILLEAGVYDLGNNKFEIDAEFVDLSSIVPIMGGTNILSYQPTNTILKGTPEAVTGILVEVSVDDVKIVGISFVSNTVSTRPLYFSSDDGGGSVGYFEKVYMYNVEHDINIYDYPDFERSVGGTWIDCVASMEYSWRINPQTSENSSAYFTSNMKNCHTGKYSFGGDFVPYVVGGEENYKFKGARLERCTSILGASDGNGSFSGCSEWGIGVDEDTVFIECEGGDQCFGLGINFKGKMYRCSGRRICVGATRLDTRIGEFSGYAEDCNFGRGSFGGQHADAVTDVGSNTGTMINCKVNIDNFIGGDKPYILNGAQIIDCVFRNFGDGVDLFKLTDGTSKILNCNLEVFPGTARHIVADSALSVSFAGCTINNKANSTTGLGANVTNIASPDGNGVYSLV